MRLETNARSRCERERANNRGNNVDRSNSSELIKEAQALLARSWRVFPLRRGEKRPVLNDWPNKATTDATVIAEWWARWPGANVGIATGAGSGLVVLDIDPRHGGDESLREREQKHGPLPETVEALTPSGGRHVYFRHPGGSIRNSAGQLGAGLDIRGDGGYVVAPPSVRADGHAWVWEAEHHPDDIAVADLPPWLLRLIAQDSKNGKARWDSAQPIISEGKRNETLTSLAGKLRREGLGKEEIYLALQGVNQARCKPPLADDEVRQIADSIGRCPLPATRADERPSFPIEVLPSPIRRFVEEGAASFPCPPDFLAIPTLCSIGAAIGRSRVLEVKPGWVETARLWWGYVAPPGDMKTPSLCLAERWAKDRQREDFQLWREETREYEQALERWKKRPKGDDASKPEPPVLRQTFVSDTTIEALGKALQENPRGLALIADELSGFFLGIGQYKKNGGSDRKHYLSIWAGKGLKVDRLTRGPVFVPSPFLAVTGGIQPDVLKDLDPETGLRDGMIHRLLLVEPTPIPATYTEQAVSSEALAAMGQLYAELYALRPEREDFEAGIFQPVVLRMADEAKNQWRDWYSEHAAEVAASSFPNLLKGPWAKLRGYSVSLALILALAEEPGAAVVGLRPVLGAITLIEEYLKPHLRRLYPHMLKKAPNEFDRCRRAVVDALQQHSRTYKELRQAIGGRYRGDLVRTVLDDLKDAGEAETRPKAGARAGVEDWKLTSEEGDL